MKRPSAAAGELGQPRRSRLADDRSGPAHEDRALQIAAQSSASAYHMLKNRVDYHDLGANHFIGADKTKSVNRLLRKIENLGFEVTRIREKQAA